MTSVESKYNQLLDENAALTRIIKQLKTTLHQERLLAIQTGLEERIKDLPAASQKRLREAFPSTDLGGLKQAVKVEQRRGAQ